MLRIVIFVVLAHVALLAWLQRGNTESLVQAPVMVGHLNPVIPDSPVVSSPPQRLQPQHGPTAPTRAKPNHTIKASPDSQTLAKISNISGSEPSQPGAGPATTAKTSAVAVNSDRPQEPSGQAQAELGRARQAPASSAAYLDNPSPHYPAISRRLGEQGQVVIRVLVGKDGVAHAGTVAQSSGYHRLDDAALLSVLGWRFVAARNAGEPQDMWFNIPVTFTLE